MRLPLRLRTRRWIAHRFGKDVLLKAWPLHWPLGYSASGSIVRDRVGALDLEYDTRSVIGTSLFTRGVFERHAIAFLKKLVQRASPGTVVLDVGANIGLHAIAAATARRDVHVTAFEPSLQTSALLERNIARNGLSTKIEIVRAAVSDSIGTAVLHECADNAYSSLKDTHRKEVIATNTVPTTTLDAFVAERKLAKVDVVKIDVEGFEGQVIAGGLGMLREHKPDLMVEIFGGEHSNPDPVGTIEQIRCLGYDAYVLGTGDPVPYVAHSDQLYNYYFTASR